MPPKRSAEKSAIMKKAAKRPNEHGSDVSIFPKHEEKLTDSDRKMFIVSRRTKAALNQPVVMTGFVY